MTLSEAERAIVNSIASALGPGPPNNPDAAQKIKEIIDKYNRRYEEEMRAPVKKAGLNMVLPKEVAGSDVVTVFGHVPGVAPGAKFKDRGQLYVAGLHATLMKGIHAPPAKHPDYARGAYSVVMSGGYVDDEDMGESFWYTGEGGIDSSSKRQIKDQSMERGANAALRNNCDSRTPVRVIRGYVSAPGEGAPVGGDGSGAGSSGGAGRGGAGGGAAGGAKKEKGFVYEGLYVVLQYKMEPSKDGPMVCKFLMYGVPGHSTVNTKVEFGIFGGVPIGGRLHARRLAGTGSSAAPPVKRTRVAKDRTAMEVARKVMLADIRRRYAGPALLSDDVSGGLEAVPIPLINEVNDEKLPADFRYIREYEWAPGVLELVAPVLQLAHREMSLFVCDDVNGTCGLAFNRMIAEKDRAMGANLPTGYEPHMEEQYNAAGCLLVTDPCGVHECGTTCTSAKCRLNKQLSNGVVLPLEVFMTPAKGWGVRCREPIPAGAFVCAYVGQLITDHMAEGRKGVDHYLFDLDFFAHIYAEVAEKGLEEIQKEIPLHKIPPVLPVADVRKVQARAAAVARKLKRAAAATASGGGSGPAAAGAAGRRGRALRAASRRRCRRRRPWPRPRRRPHCLHRSARWSAAAGGRSAGGDGPAGVMHRSRGGPKRRGEHGRRRRRRSGGAAAAGCGGLRRRGGGRRRSGSVLPAADLQPGGQRRRRRRRRGGGSWERRGSGRGAAAADGTAIGGGGGDGGGGRPGGRVRAAAGAGRARHGQRGQVHQPQLRRQPDHPGRVRGGLPQHLPVPRGALRVPGHTRDDRAHVQLRLPQPGPRR